MGFNYGGINQQASLHIPQPSNYSCFNEQAPWAGYMGPDIGLIPHEFFHHTHPHPCDMRSAIQIEIEKERIREEIIISEMIARRRSLEAELMMEKELARQRGGDGFPDGSSPQEVFESPMSLEQTNGRCESGGFDTLQFQRGNADLRIMEVKAVFEKDKEKLEVIGLAKLDENISGPERKAVAQPEADTSELPSNVVLKAKEEWRCALCQVSASSERGLNEHLQGKKHKSKKAALTSEKAGDNYKIGPNAKKVELKDESLLVDKSGEESPTISDELKENQSGSLQEVQKNGDTPNPDNLGNGSESVRETGKIGENISRPERKASMHPEADTSELPSNVVFKVEEECSCALCQVSASSARALNELLQRKEHKSEEAPLTSKKAGDNYRSGLNAKKVELKVKSLLDKKFGEENQTISDNLKEIQLGSVQEVQKNGDPPNPDNFGKNGFSAKKVEFKAKTWLIKKAGVENPTRSDNLKENQSVPVQEVQKNGDHPNPDNLGENGFNAKKVEFIAKPWLIKKIGVEYPTISDNLKENQSGSVQEVQKNGDTTNPDNLGGNRSESVRETGKNGCNISGPERNAVTQSEAGTSELLSNVTLKVREEWSCTLCQVSASSERGLNEHLQGKKHKSKESALTSQKAEDNYKIGLNAKKVELKASLLVEKTGEGNPTISDNLKENQSGSVQEVQKNGDRKFWCEMYEVRTVSQKAKDVSVEDKEKPKVIDLAKPDENISGLERKAVTKPEADTSELPSNDVLKVKEEWSCALCQVSAGGERGLNMHLQGKKHKSKEAALTSQKAGDKHRIGLNAKKVELEAKSLLVERNGEENPAISHKLKENQSGPVQEMQKNGDGPHPNNFVGNGFNSKKVEIKTKTWLIKKTGVENPKISDNLKGNHSESVQEVQKNGDPPSLDKLGETGSESVQETGKYDDMKNTNYNFCCETYKVGLNEHMQGKKHKSKEVALTSQKAGNKYYIGFNAKKVKLKAETWLMKKTVVENSTISNNSKENQSGSVQEVQKNGDPPNSNNLGKNGVNAKKVEFKATSWVTKKTVVEKPTILNNLKENQLGSAQEVQKNCNPPNPDNLGENVLNARKVELQAKTWLIKKTGVDNPTISYNLKENHSGSVQEVQRNGYPPDPDNSRKDGFNAKKVEVKAKTWVMKKTGSENPTILDNLGENGSESVQEVQKNGDPPNPDNMGENGSESVQEMGKNDDPENKKYNFWCEICKVWTFSHKEMNEHEMGKKHVNRVRKSDRNVEAGSKIKIWLKKETKM